MSFKYSLTLRQLILLPLLLTVGCAPSLQDMKKMRTDLSQDKVAKNLETLVEYISDPPDEPVPYAEAMDTASWIALNGNASSAAAKQLSALKVELQRNANGPDLLESEDWAEQGFEVGETSIHLSAWALFSLGNMRQEDQFDFLSEILGNKKFFDPTLDRQIAAANGLSQLLGFVKESSQSLELKRTLLERICIARVELESAEAEEQKVFTLRKVMDHLEQETATNLALTRLLEDDFYSNLPDNVALELLQIEYRLLDKQLKGGLIPASPADLGDNLKALANRTKDYSRGSKFFATVRDILAEASPAIFFMAIAEQNPTWVGHLSNLYRVLDAADRADKAADDNPQMLYVKDAEGSILINHRLLFGYDYYSSARKNLGQASQEKLAAILEVNKTPQRGWILSFMLKEDPDVLNKVLLKELAEVKGKSTKVLLQELRFMGDVSEHFKANSIRVEENHWAVAHWVGKCASHKDADKLLAPAADILLESAYPKLLEVLSGTMLKLSTTIKSRAQVNLFIASLEKEEAAQPGNFKEQLRERAPQFKEALIHEDEDNAMVVISFLEQRDINLLLELILNNFFLDPDRKLPHAGYHLALGVLTQNAGERVDAEVRERVTDVFQKDILNANEEISLASIRFLYALAKPGEHWRIQAADNIYKRWQQADFKPPTE